MSHGNVSRNSWVSTSSGCNAVFARVLCMAGYLEVATLWRFTKVHVKSIEAETCSSCDNQDEAI
jgi:hypothetical protein